MFNPGLALNNPAQNVFRMCIVQHTYFEGYPLASKEYGKVRGVFKFRFFIWFSQFHVAVFGNVQADNKNGPGVSGADVQPSKCLGDPDFPLSHFFSRRCLLGQAPHDKAPNNESGDEGHNWIKAEVDSKIETFHFAPFPVNAKPATSISHILLFIVSTARIHASSTLTCL